MNYKIVPQRSRMNFLPSITPFFIQFENLLYQIAEHWIEGYDGGYWEFATCDNGAKFCYPTGESQYNVLSEGSQTDFPLSPVATGAAITLITLSNLSLGLAEAKQLEAAEHVGEQYHKLYDFIYSDDSPLTKDDREALVAVLN